MPVLKSICVYCGSAVGRRPGYTRAARDLGTRMAESGRTLVYGGGGIGLMGEIARAVRAGGGQVVGVIPGHLNTLERANHEVELRVVDTMHERKQLMADLSEAFVGLPGGLGTFDELFEILTWNQIGLHGKPVGLLNVEGYFDAFLGLIEQAVREGFAPQTARSRIVVKDSAEALLGALDERASRTSP